MFLSIIRVSQLRIFLKTKLRNSSVSRLDTDSVISTTQGRPYNMGKSRMSELGVLSRRLDFLLEFKHTSKKYTRSIFFQHEIFSMFGLENLALDSN
jgi:hypothetical protein